MKVFGTWNSLVHIFVVVVCYELALLGDSKKGYLVLRLILEASLKLLLSFLLCVVLSYRELACLLKVPILS